MVHSQSSTFQREFRITAKSQYASSPSIWTTTVAPMNRNIFVYPLGFMRHKRKSSLTLGNLFEITCPSLLRLSLSGSIEFLQKHGLNAQQDDVLSWYRWRWRLKNLVTSFNFHFHTSPKRDTLTCRLYENASQSLLCLHWFLLAMSRLSKPPVFLWVK